MPFIKLIKISLPVKLSHNNPVANTLGLFKTNPCSMNNLMTKLFIPLVLLLALNVKGQNLHKAIQKSVEQLEYLNPDKKEVSILFLRSSLNEEENETLENYTQLLFGRYLKKSEVYKWIAAFGVKEILEEEKWILPQDYNTYEMLNATNFRKSKLITSSFLLVNYNDLQDSVSIQSVWIPGGVYENHKAVETVFSKDEFWYELLGLAVPAEAAQVEIRDTVVTAGTEPTLDDSIKVSQKLPMAVSYDNLDIKLISAERKSSKLVFTFLLQNDTEDFRTRNIGLRLINSEGEEFRSKKNTLKHRKLVQGVPTKCVVEFEKNAERSDELPVLEINVDFNREILHLRKIPISE